MVHCHKPECLVKKIDCLGQSHSTSTNVNECLSRWYPQDCWAFCCQTWCGDASSWIIMSHKNKNKQKIVCCLQGQSHSKGSYNQNMIFYYIFWTADPSLTKFGLMVHHYKLDCLVKRLDCCVQGHGPSKSSKILANVPLDGIFWTAF